MIDLSEEPIEENIEICKDYLERMSKIGILLEMELGITGGEEDGVNNEDVDIEDLYSKPEEIYQVYEELSKISPMFTVAAAFGNVHGVYSPGNVKLEPDILDRAQDYICAKLGDDAPEDKKPVLFVFHGGSGSDISDIRRAIGYGVIKMNIDTDTQWSYWEGIKNFEAKWHDYLQTQIGNPDGGKYEYMICISVLITVIMHMHMYLNLYACMYMCMHACIYMHACMHLYIYACI
jgi:fructose-bisphosphate aldolase class II